MMYSEPGRMLSQPVNMLCEAGEVQRRRIDSRREIADAALDLRWENGK